MVLGDDKLRWSVKWSDRRKAYIYSVTLGQRTNVKEGEGLLALEELEARDLACYSQFAEDAHV